MASYVGDTLCLGFGDETKLSVEHRVLSVPRGDCVGRVQVGATQLGVVTSLSYVCRSCGCNAHNALCNRHGVKPPLITASFDVAAGMLDRFAATVHCCYLQQMELDEVYWRSRWPSSKRQLIVKSQEVDALEPTRGQSMIKREGHSSVPKKARLIQFYPNLATQAAFAPEFAALQKAVCIVFADVELSPGIYGTIASGMNANDFALWMQNTRARYQRPMYYERDGKNWDATMQRQHHELKKRLYTLVGPRFVEFVDECFRVKFTCRSRSGNLRYWLTGTVKSGHNDTTLGNSVINLCIAYSALRLCGLRGSILVAGDDLLIVVDGDFDEHGLASVEATFGIVPEYRKFSSHLDVAFVSGCWLGDQELVFVPKLGRLLARLWWTVHPPSQRRLDSYRHSIIAGFATCRDLPIYRAFLSSHDANAPLMPVDKRHRFVFGVSGKCDDPWGAIMTKYELSRAEIADFEALLLALRGERVFLRHPVVDKINAVDLADLADRRACAFT